MSAERYTHGHHRSVVSSHATRTAEDSAGFLLPYLTPDMRLLDLGCGPGSITLDLAANVAEVVGIDSAPEALAHAEEAKSSRRVANAEFQAADVYDLPFADASFDVVYAHQLIQHLRDPIRALHEARRVVRPGGLVAVRDADYGTMIHDPHEPRLDTWRDLYHEVARRDGGEPDAGRMLGRWFTAAGFTEVFVTTSTWTYHHPDDVAGWKDLWVSRLLEAGFGEHAIEMGLADRAALEDLADGFVTWAANPAAFFAFLHGEVVAVR